MKKLSWILTLLVMAFVVNAQTPNLRFHKDGTFKIVQFTDIHYIYMKPDSSKFAIDNMNAVLDAEKPDLVVITGDLIFAPPALPGLDKVLEPLIKHKIPYAIAWGNHDEEQGVTRENIQKYVETKPYNMGKTAVGVPGYSNFALTIESSASDKAAAVVYCFDSHSGSKLPEIKGYDWIYPEQVTWYINKSKEITQANGGNPLPAMAFFHIPFPEYEYAMVEPEIRWVGYRWEDVSCPAINSGLFTAMLQQKDVVGVFVGHDHDSDFITKYHGIRLAYGRYSGGHTVYNHLPEGNGARVIELQEGSRDFTTWIRLHDNRILQFLHSNF